MDFKSTIEVLPDLLSYFIPGAVSILIYNFLFLKKIEHTELLFWDIIISYLTKIISEAIVPEQFTSVAHILFCVFLPLIWFALNRVGVLSWFSKKTRLNDTENIWLRTIDFEKDNYIWLHLSDGKEYYGIVYSVDSNWIILKSYDVYNDSKNKNEQKSEQEQKDVYYQILCVPTSKIERFEISYEDNDKMKKKFYPH